MEMTYIDAPADLTMQIGEAMFTQRAIRRLQPEKPVSDGDLKTILDAASKAPNGGNAQPARFLVIRDGDTIAAFGKLYHEAWWAKRRDELQQEIKKLSASRSQFIKEKIEAEGGADDSLDEKIYRAVKEQTAKIGLTYESDSASY